MIQLMIKNIYTLESYLYQKFHPSIARNKYINEHEKPMRTNKLSIGAKYNFDRLTKFADAECKKCHLRKPQITLINNSDTQMSTNGCSGLDRNVLTLHIYKGNLESVESFDALKRAICHEIGHTFAPKIIRKHHLCKYPWYMWMSEIRHVCFLCSIVICCIFLSFFFGFIFSILGFFLSLFLTISLIINHLNKNHKVPTHYRHMCEIVSDEFSLYQLRNLHDAINAFRQDHNASNDKMDIVGDKNIQHFLNQSHSFHNLNEDLRINDNKCYSELWKYNWIATDDDHPSDLTRVKHLERFWNSGFKKW